MSGLSSLVEGLREVFSEEDERLKNKDQQKSDIR
jgi:hypothetical protein